MPRDETKIEFTLRPAGHACLSPVLMYKSCPGRFKTWPRQRLFFRHPALDPGRLYPGPGSCFVILKTEAPRDDAPTPKHPEIGILVRRSFALSSCIFLAGRDCSITSQLLRDQCEICRKSKATLMSSENHAGDVGRVYLLCA